jgi:hypothetical protein
MKTKSAGTAKDDLIELPIPGRPAQKCNLENISQRKKCKKKHIIIIHRSARLVTRNISRENHTSISIEK